MANYNDLAALNQIKAEIYAMSDQELRHEAMNVYGLRSKDYGSVTELREAMIAIEERNYFK